MPWDLIREYSKPLTLYPNRKALRRLISPRHHGLDLFNTAWYLIVSHSERKARTGSIDAARIAGATAAIMPIPNSISAVVAKPPASLDTSK